MNSHNHFALGDGEKHPWEISCQRKLSQAISFFFCILHEMHIFSINLKVIKIISIMMYKLKNRIISFTSCVFLSWSGCQGLSSPILAFIFNSVSQNPSLLNIFKTGNLKVLFWSLISPLQLSSIIPYNHFYNYWLINLSTIN